MVLNRIDRDRLVALLKSYASSSSSTSAGALIGETIRTADVVEPMSVPPSVITMNSTVSLIDIETGSTSLYSLVYPSEANVDAMKVSVLAPLGASILGRAEGDVVEVLGPAGLRRFLIHKVAYQPESRLRSPAAVAAQ